MPNQKMPVLFVGHGSPLNAIENNEFTDAWKQLAAEIPKPKAILCISAHWLREGTAVTAMEHPKTIHDFYGFPKALYQMQYKAKGSKKLANEIKKIIKTARVSLDYEWGLDHGTWSVLSKMYPKADIPVLQLSLDYSLPLEKVFEIGEELSKLRENGVLIICSGNIVHNLMRLDMRAKPYQWAVDFDHFVNAKLIKKDYDALLNYTNYRYAALAHPTNDHYLPLIYAIGAATGEKPGIFNDKIIYGSVSMMCVAFGI